MKNQVQQYQQSNHVAVKTKPSVVVCCRAFLNINSGGESPYQLLSFPHQWDMFAPPLVCHFDSLAFLLLSYLKYMYTYMNCLLYSLYQYFKSAFKSLLICKFCIYLECLFLKCPTIEKSLKNSLVCSAKICNSQLEINCQGGLIIKRKVGKNSKFNYQGDVNKLKDVNYILSLDFTNKHKKLISNGDYCINGPKTLEIRT